MTGPVFLAIDGGNTRLKATWMADGEEPVVTQYSYSSTDELLADLERFGATEAAMACVGHVDTRLAETLRHLLQERFLLITPSTPVPIGIAYPRPEQLGLDRKATSVAAARMYPSESIMVIDAGTALTCDIVGPAGFICGSISPGLSMRLRALHEFTAALPELDARRAAGMPAPFAVDTPSAIRGGTVNGFMQEVAGDIRMAAVQFPELHRVILTGGDAPFISAQLQEHAGPSDIFTLPEGLTIINDPHLLAKGVRAIYLHHENEN
ncbi:MAG: type III pantothenate kinase [Bacteroidales bacterium]|nr:type III pantothenate kinase [Bacteroidales bacterium]